MNDAEETKPTFKQWKILFIIKSYYIYHSTIITTMIKWKKLIFFIPSFQFLIMVCFIWIVNNYNSICILLESWPTSRKPTKGKKITQSKSCLFTIFFTNDSVGSCTSYKNQNSERGVRRGLHFFVLISEKTKMSNHL